MYEELVKSLRICSRCDFGQDCNGCTQKSDDAFCCDKLLHEAADAIEQLSADLERSIDWSGFWQEEAGEVLKKFQTTVAKIPRWIPVTERMPQEDGRYLTLYPLKTKPRVWRHKVYGFAKDLVEVDKYDFNEHKPGFYGYDGEYGYYEDKDVTHWMPLPPPPKDGES